MKEFNLLRVYLVIISVVGLIGMIIGYGNFGYQVIKRNIITDDEYVIGSYDNYTFTQCENKDPAIASPKEATAVPDAKVKTPEEVRKCKDDARKNILARRAYDYKDNLISGIVWGTIFLLVFVTHFPVFYRKYKRGE